MKVVIAYPVLNCDKGTPLLGQNRQFQYFKEPTYIYPVVPATAATLLNQAGHEVIWLDAIAEGISYETFIEIIRREEPDLIAFETKTPVVKQHWQIINELKELNKPHNPITVLFGDHVTALPEESFQNSQLDFVLAGGDYDFLLLNLCDSLTFNPYTLHLNKLEPGIYYRDNGQIKNTGPFQLNHDLNALPFIDRDLTQWQLYAYKNGNYKRTPGTYIMSGRDCWHREEGGCSFCAWPILYPEFKVRQVDNVLDEIGQLIEKYKVREIMDDTGTFPVGDWLKEFCKGLIERGYNKKIYFDCNMRFGALSYEDFRLMKEANFRLLLFGLESANQMTLDRLNKNLKVDKIIEDCRLARRAGLYPHITIMFGYPWETYEDACKTLKLGKWLLKKGFAYTVQATLVIPYPGTALFAECKEKGWLKTLDWSHYDMKEPIMNTPIPDKPLMRFVQGVYAVAFNPEFIYHRLKAIEDLDDLKYFKRTGIKVLGHIRDFAFKS